MCRARQQRRGLANFVSGNPSSGGNHHTAQKEQTPGKRPTSQLQTCEQRCTSELDSAVDKQCWIRGPDVSGAGGRRARTGLVGPPGVRGATRRRRQVERDCALRLVGRRPARRQARLRAANAISVARLV